MGYVAVTGGQEAIDASVELLKEYRSSGNAPVEIHVIRDRMGLLIDRVMSEAGDCLEMNGFISHLKLPHYVTFQSKLDGLRNRKRSLEHGKND